MYLQNLHTHTCYCDGADWPEDIILTAIEKNFASVGFSGHSYMAYSKYLGTVDKTEDYKNAVAELKIKYQDKIEIYLGLEVDMYSQPNMSGYDYLIGSVHYLKCGDAYVGFDRGQKDVENIIAQYFGGDGMKYAKVYYETLAQLPDYGNFDIVGHFDIITKHSDNYMFFDAESKQYLNVAIEAAEALAGKIPLFEVNTGAMARGYRISPYPHALLLKELKRLGFGAVITSDCHEKSKLDYKFNDATELLKNCGFKEKYVFTDDGFVAVPL